MSNDTQQTVNSKTGFWSAWLPLDRSKLENVLIELIEDVERTDDQTVHPVIRDFKVLIRRDSVVRMYLTQMIEQIPTRYQHHHLKSVDLMLQLLNAVLSKAPLYYPKDTYLLAGTPFSAILIWTMGTPAGFAAYRNEKINFMFKRLLWAWCDFLSSRESLYVLNKSPQGWMCEQAQKDLVMEDYRYEPNAEHWGFTSWNDFFTRNLRDTPPEPRPIDDPGNNKVIVSACDSTVYKIRHNLNLETEFWIKEQPYSLIDMLDDNYVDDFHGGSVYQAFLSPYNYHRWHSPVSGTVKKAYVKEGLYFSQADSEGEDPTDQDHSEGYITNVQTRAIFFIECDDPGIGLVCVMPVGMVEISSCIINPIIVPGYHVTKGEEIGYFQFGGSTHCLVFRSGVIDTFFPKEGDYVQMGRKIALAK